MLIFPSMRASLYQHKGKMLYHARIRSNVAGGIVSTAEWGPVRKRVRVPIDYWLDRCPFKAEEGDRYSLGIPTYHAQEAVG